MSAAHHGEEGEEEEEGEEGTEQEDSGVDPWTYCGVKAFNEKSRRAKGNRIGGILALALMPME